VSDIPLEERPPQHQERHILTRQSPPAGRSCGLARVNGRQSHTITALVEDRPDSDTTEICPAVEIEAAQ
jgi:hypothetical protein